MKQSDKDQSREFVRFVVADLEGNYFDLRPDSISECPLLESNEPQCRLLRQFVTNELSHNAGSQRPPRHIEYMRRHRLLDYCDVSEKGHFKWYPKGLMMHKLLLDYAARLSRQWGAFEMKNPMVIRGDNNIVGELMGEFHERDYRVDGGRGTCYLRYASDPLAFPFMQKVQFSRKQAPLKVYEEASCFRNELQGSVSGLKRVRNFMMTDMHAACCSIEQARAEFELLCRRFAGLMNDIIAHDRWVLGWAGTVDFFEDNKEWLIGISKDIGVPAFFKLMPAMSHYYAIKNEYQAICEDGSNIQVSTVQWDVKDGKRFDIGFIDDDGDKHPCPVIIHASSFGSIERTLCAILENIAIDEAAGNVPRFPLWLSPTQVRVVPVSSDYLAPALGLASRLELHDIRADVDDGGDTVGKKVRNAEREWIPFVVVIGKKEADSGRLSVRFRENGNQIDISEVDLVAMIRNEARDMPFRPLPLPQRLSMRPLFCG